MTTAAESEVLTRVGPGTPMGELMRQYWVPAELIVVGIGVIPNVELAAEAGLYMENGVKTDQPLLTSDLAIYAVGD